MGTLRLLERVSIILSIVILCGIIMPVLFATLPASANGGNVTTNAATDVTSDTATLNGEVNWKPADDPVWVSFEYGKVSGALDQFTPDQVMGVLGPFSDGVGGLLPSTTYYFRAVWFDGSITTWGDELSFTTSGGATLYYGFEVNHRLTVELNEVSCTVPSRYTGEIYEAVDLTSRDGKYNVKLPAGSIALDSEGKCLFKLDIEVYTELPDPPDIPNVVAYVCLCEPAGATLEGPLTLTVNYNPEDLAEGTAEESLRIAYWDGASWQVMNCTVDAGANTVSTSITKVI